MSEPDLTWMAGVKLAEIERLAVTQTLKSCEWNKAQAARMLGISEKTIYNKLKQYNASDRRKALASSQGCKEFNDERA